MEYDFSDAYGHPGTPLLERGPWGRAVLRKVGEDGMLWAGDGASAEGLRPFVDERGWSDCKRRRRLWRASVGCYEYPVKVLSKGAARRVAPEVEADVELLLISRRQTQEQPPQVLLRAASAPSAAAASDGAKSDDSRVLATLSDPPHPQPTLKGVGKSLIKYERADGVGLSGTLYTPAGYEPCRDGPLPTILWAYPREFKSKKSAGQVRGSEHTFTVVNWGSPLFWLTQGYAVLDGFAMPIIGEGEEHENDRYVEQLRMNAEAAVKELRRRGVSDHRLAVGGHSYGAFMTANLLAHTDFFCAGIARNGAYNRSLTPFGFQAEERPFWDAKATYAAMSPFNHADQISAPLLLIHSQADTNPGTFPMQSERMFAALKGLGACRARLCLLPNEAHWYRARETIMHVLAEQDEWLEAHVRHAKPPSPEAQDVTPKEKNEKPNQKE
jgi:dipeptidyl aminopeptidase/acylaminoacyl peptidase